MGIQRVRVIFNYALLNRLERSIQIKTRWTTSGRAYEAGYYYMVLKSIEPSALLIALFCRPF